MTSTDPLPPPGKLAPPPGKLAPLEREYLYSALPVLAVMLPAGAAAIALQVQELRSALRHDSGLVRALLLADQLVDAGITGYAQGKHRQLRRTETPEETRARRAEIRPVTWRNFARPVRGAVASGLAAYALAIGVQYAARALKPRMNRAIDIAEQFKAERLAKQKEAMASEAGVEEAPVSPEDAVREAIEQLERLGGRAGKTTISPGSLERILGPVGGKIVEVSEEPRHYASREEKTEEPWSGMTTAPRDQVKAALSRKLAEQERERRAASGADDIVE